MSKSKHGARVWGIIPAAGMSRRMGRSKQVLAYKKSTIAGTVAHTLLAAGLDGVVVVTRTELCKDLQLPADSRIHVAINDDNDSEMLDSIRIGLGKLDQLHPRGDDGVLVIPADMPSLSTQSCRACAESYLSQPRRIVIATYKGNRGHPIVFPFGMRTIIEKLEGGLNMLPRTRPDAVLYVEADDPGVQTDIDTAEDYQELL